MSAENQTIVGCRTVCPVHMRKEAEGAVITAMRMSRMLRGIERRWRWKGLHPVWREENAGSSLAWCMLSSQQNILKPHAVIDFRSIEKEWWGDSALKRGL